MPAPMPPQGGPPQAPPPGPGGPPPQGQAGGAGAISTLLINVDKALDHLTLVIGQSKATNPQEKQLITQINEAYGKLMDMLGIQGGSDEDEQGHTAGPPPGPGAQGQTVPPEAAGNRGAVPSPM